MLPGAAPQKVPPDDLQIELDGLRQGLLDTLLLLTLLAPIAWLAYIMLHAYASGWVDLGMLQLVVCAFVTLALRRRHVQAASWVYLSSLSLCYALIVLAHPESIQPAIAVPVIILAQALLGGWHSLLLATLLTGCGLSAQILAGATPITNAALAMLSVVYGAWATTWLTSRQLRLAISWALSGWERAEQMLKETRERRGELYRALRALEEATYRIERMNSELIFARSEAERARAFKDHYATTISHELRGPLSLILGFSRLMALSPERYEASLPAPYYADVDAIYRNAQHLSTLLDDILDLAQIEAERLPLIKQGLDIGQEVCATAVEIVRPLAERKGLALTIELAHDLPNIIADGVRLRQVLLNLLTNAIRHTDQGGITVICQRQDEAVLISVTDTGSGIAPEHLSRLFDEFYQTPSHGERQGSSGLGLSISKQLVELHGGRMWVKSAPGQGTSFFLTLPLPGAVLIPDQVANSAPVSAHVSVQDQPGHLSTPVCLVLHTSAQVTRVLSRHLEGYRVIAMDDDEQALSVISDLHPTAILTPNTKGNDLATLLGANGYDVPIIACDFPETALDDRIEGVLARLTKPVSADVLASLMRRVEREGLTTILLADDEPDFVRLTESMLMALPRPYRILQAYDGVQALERMRQVVPDVLFIDLVMPRMGGAEVIAAMRQDPLLEHVPVIVLSAQDTAEQGLILRTPLFVLSPQPVEMGQAAKGLVALLDMLRTSRAGQGLDPPL